MLLFPRAEDRSPWGDFWFSPVGGRGSAGVQVTAETAMRQSAVYGCVRVLAETMAMLPFLLSTTVGRKRRYLSDHWIYGLMARRPNAFQNAFEWREMMMGHLALRGNGYNRIVTNAAGRVTDLLPLHPDRVTVEIDAADNIRYRLKNRDGSTTTIPRGEMWHIRGLSSDGIVGLSPIELARETIGAGLAVQEYGARYFQNNARPGGGWIEHPTSFKDKTSRDTFKESWSGALTGQNLHKTAVLEYGMKYHDLPLNNNEAQFLETRAFQVVDICRIFRVPPHLVADLTRGTFSNIEQQSLEFMAYSMAPWAERFEASIEATFIEDGDNLQCEFDFANLMRGDAKSRSAFYQSGITSGWLTRNEAREAEGYDPIDGLDEPLAPLNMGPGDGAEDPDGAEGAGAQPGADPESPPEGPVREDAPGGADQAARRGAARATTLALAIAQRVVRKEAAALSKAWQAGAAGFPAAAAAFYDKHAAFVAEAFGCAPATAARWCNDCSAAFAAAGANVPARIEAMGQNSPLQLVRLIMEDAPQ